MLLSLIFLAQASTATVSPQATPEATDNKPVCRSVMPKGSRIPERVCHTKAEWDQLARESQDNFTSVMNKQGLEGGPSGR